MGTLSQDGDLHPHMGTLSQDGDPAPWSVQGGSLRKERVGDHYGEGEMTPRCSPNCSLCRQTRVLLGGFWAPALGETGIRCPHKHQALVPSGGRGIC